MKSYLEILEQVNAGNLNPLQAFIILKEQAHQIDTSLKGIQDLAINEACKYGEKSFKAYGASCELRNSPATYKFCGHILSLEERLKKLKEMAKINEFADPDTGEIIEKAIKITGKEIIAISFK